MKHAYCALYLLLVHSVEVNNINMYASCIYFVYYKSGSYMQLHFRLPL